MLEQSDQQGCTVDGISPFPFSCSKANAFSVRNSTLRYEEQRRSELGHRRVATAPMARLRGPLGLRMLAKTQPTEHSGTSSLLTPGLPGAERHERGRTRSVNSFLSAVLIVWLVAGLGMAQPHLTTEPQGADGGTEGAPRRAAIYAGGYFALSMVVLGNTWYKDRERVPFHFYDDNRAFLQVDKFGHAFGAYSYSYIGYHSLVGLGMTKNEALLFGGPLGAVMQFPIELMDGLYEGYGFSWGDVAANAVGSALVVGQELVFGEQVATYKFSYAPSPYASDADGLLGTGRMDRVLKDYNGQTYWLSVPISRLAPNNLLPRWLSIAAGYGADGMYGEFDNESRQAGVVFPPATRRRQFLLSLDVDWNSIQTDSDVMLFILQALTFVKLPFPALE